MTFTKRNKTCCVIICTFEGHHKNIKRTFWNTLDRFGLNEKNTKSTRATLSHDSTQSHQAMNKTLLSYQIYTHVKQYNPRPASPHDRKQNPCMYDFEPHVQTTSITTHDLLACSFDSKKKINKSSS